jgi:hypothetical protein
VNTMNDNGVHTKLTEQAPAASPWRTVSSRIDPDKRIIYPLGPINYRILLRVPPVCRGMSRSWWPGRALEVVEVPAKCGVLGV